MKRNKLPILTIVLTGVVLVLVFFLIKQGRKSKDEVQIKIDRGEAQVVIDNTGGVNFSSKGTKLSQTITRDELTRLAAYLKQNGETTISQEEINNYYRVEIIDKGTTTIVYLPLSDGIINIIYDSFTGGNGADNGSQNGSDGFVFPTATPTSTPGDDNGDDDDYYGVPTMPSDCPLWLLSFCVYPRRPTPTLGPTSTPTPLPDVQPDCSFWEHFIFKRAVVSNSFCEK